MDSPVPSQFSPANTEPAWRTPRSAFRVPELLAPAGDWECAKAAVENGADAIYFGLDRFNARMRANNFTEADLPKLMEFLHRRGVKGYVTFNTLVFADELAAAEEYLRTIIAAGVDAAIVQDAGICRLIRRLSPDFPIHASTQMTITSVAGIEFARELGCNLVVLARENSLKEIEAIQKQLANDECRMTKGMAESSGEPFVIRHSSFPLEVFVHGALCVAYSGQCLTSEALGGRSANRGECAQACRMPYELISDGKKVDLGDRKYLLSPQDLAGLDVLPELVRLGVASLKIEGRLKSPEYVANITRVYRKALDTIAGECSHLLSPHPDPLPKERGQPDVVARTFDATKPAFALHRILPLPKGEGRGEGERKVQSPRREPPYVGCYNEKDCYDMEMAFSRGLFTGWFGGTDNQALVHARFGKKRGVYLGEVAQVGNERVWLKLEGPLKPGDGVVFDAGNPEIEEEGGRVYEIQNPKSEIRIGAVELRFGQGDIDFSRVHIGDKVWKTSDPELDRRVRQTFEGEQVRFQRPVRIEVHGHVGAPLTLILRDGEGHVVQLASTMPLAGAEKQPLTTTRLNDQLGRLGGTPFRLGALENKLDGEVILPVSELNRLRREGVAELERLRAQPERWALEGSKFQVPSFKATRRIGDPLCDPQLIVLVRSLPQLDAALRCGVETIYCELEDPKRYREAVTLFHTARGCDSSLGATRPTIWVAPPRITKPGEEWILKQVRSCNADGYLIRNYDHLEFFQDCRRRGDFSLNVSNMLTAEHFITRHGLEHVTASYDLNVAQLLALLESAPPEWFEITLHQHVPMFHMEHCVFCAFLTNGHDYRDCGRPCDRHDVRVRDRVGMEHPLKADAGCRNTVFNAVAQTGAEFFKRFVAAGARQFRIELLTESPAEVERTIAQYRKLFRSETTGVQLWKDLKLVSQLGVTRGPLERAERR